MLGVKRQRWRTDEGQGGDVRLCVHRQGSPSNTSLLSHRAQCLDCASESEKIYFYWRLLQKIWEICEKKNEKVNTVVKWEAEVIRMTFVKPGCKKNRCFNCVLPVWACGWAVTSHCHCLWPVYLTQWTKEMWEQPGRHRHADGFRCSNRVKPFWYNCRKQQCVCVCAGVCSCLSQRGHECVLKTSF